MTARFPIRAAALAAVLLLAACSDAPTAATASAAGPAMNAAPQPTVTNSGGNPLISWPALSGATSYTVAYNEYVTVIQKPSFATSTEEYDWPLTTTTATSYLDTGRTWTGDSSCTAYGTYQTRIKQFRYRVTANYPTGTATTFVAAPVSPC